MRKILLLVIVILLTAGFFFLRSNQYQVIHAQRGEVTEAVYGLGRVKSNKRFEIILGVLSTVTKQYINEGEEVKSGAPLITIENQSTFRAPFPGTVTLLRVRLGETALPNIPILRLEDLQDRYIEVSIEQQAALRLKPGQTAKISFESMRGNILEGKLIALYSRENEFVAHIHVTGLNPSVLPGMTADVTIETGKVNNAMLVPAKAIVKNVITVKRDGKWQAVKAEKGAVSGEFVEVLGVKLTPEDEIRVRK